MELGLAIRESHCQVIDVKKYDGTTAEAFVGDGVTGMKVLPRLMGKGLATPEGIFDIF